MNNITEGSQESSSQISTMHRRCRSNFVHPITVKGRTPKASKMREIEDGLFLLDPNGNEIDQNTILFIYKKDANGCGFKFTYIRWINGEGHLFKCNGCIRINQRKCSAIVSVSENGVISVKVSKHASNCKPRLFIMNGSSSIFEEKNKNETENSVEAASDDVLVVNTAPNLFINIPSSKKIQKVTKLFEISYKPDFLDAWYAIHKNTQATSITSKSKVKDVIEISTNDYFACLSILLTSSEDYGNQIKNTIKEFYCKKMMPETQDFELFAKVAATDELEDVHLDIFAQMTNLCVAVLNDGQLSTYGNMNKPLILLTKIGKQYVPVSEIEN